MQSTQITTFTAFRFSGVAARFWAFSQMGLAPLRLRATPGARFYKLVGSGGANGFALKPNFGLYGLLQVWDDEAAAQQFFEKHAVMRAYRRKAEAVQTLFMRNTLSHGLWDGRAPFEPAAAFDPDAPVAVITRATIHPRHMLRFWRFVPAVSRDVEDKPGLRFAVGIGELPLILQATFSLWDRGRDMMEFAYKRDEHRAVIQKTRELGWYKEELFARFLPYRSEGSGVWSTEKIPF